ncbi:MAG: pyridoxal-phosphate dependent enzyme [Bacteroidetes bacterium]|jgi:1-aminocyclopropane-1-carboxylate deaminase|nr:pyridoxal-phosphate dependent enzyme [Bacteroidota bacterium]
MFNHVPFVQEIKTPFVVNSGVRLFMQRDDQIHPFVSGNKWFKLKHNFRDFEASKATSILTFGGAYSNHLVATAVACAMQQIPCVGIVRGDELKTNSNYILRLCAEFGMTLKFVSREVYTTYKNDTSELEQDETFVIPEGGDNASGILGCQDMVKDYSLFDSVAVPVGTSTTFSGVINGSRGQSHIHGFAALKDASYLSEVVRDNTSFDNWTLQTKFSYGGFGRFDQSQSDFNKQFASETGILLDPVYTGKMMRGIYAMINELQFKRGQKVLCIHTGGLTGLLSQKWLDS